MRDRKCKKIISGLSFLVSGEEIEKEHIKVI